MILQEFNFVTALNKDILIQYFRENLRSFIQIQLNTRGRELDFWEKVIEKVVDVKAKALLQKLSGSWEINTKCFYRYKLAKKKADSKKNKSIDISFADISSRKQSSFTYQISSSYLKKD